MFTLAHMNLEQRGEENIPSDGRQRTRRIFFFFPFVYIFVLFIFFFLYSLNLFDGSVLFLKFKDKKSPNNMYIMTDLYLLQLSFTSFRHFYWSLFAYGYLEFL